MAKSSFNNAAHLNACNDDGSVLIV